jgi:hypothetical protein
VDELMAAVKDVHVHPHFLIISNVLDPGFDGKKRLPIAPGEGRSAGLETFFLKTVSSKTWTICGLGVASAIHDELPRMHQPPEDDLM